MAKDEIPPHIKAWQEASQSYHWGKYDQPEIPMAVSICEYYEGEHYPGPDCPHDNETDELGPVMKAGWTVLDIR